jgi:inositol-phosphate phosphatase/L-galactose 1-phosphate phosphatase/histidinol-phosphatase
VHNTNITNTIICPEDYITLAFQLADIARIITLKYFRKPILISDKIDYSPVTVADRETEIEMRKLIFQVAPNHGIYGEEYGAFNIDDAEWIWVLDPIDGTKAFITGKPLFCTLIALLYKGIPVLGIIDQPVLNERWVGISGRISTLNDQPIQVRSCSELRLAALYATSPEMFITDNDNTTLAWESIYTSVKLLCYGSDCYAYGLLASGYIDLIVEASLKPYDYLPLVAIIHGAGGLITDWSGHQLNLKSNGKVVASGDKRIHTTTLAKLAFNK